MPADCRQATKIAVVLVAAGLHLIQAEAARDSTYLNPVMDVDFPDPSVVRTSDGVYWAVGTMSAGFNIQIASSTNLTVWQHDGDALPNGNSWGISLFLAPDISYHRTGKGAHNGGLLFTLYYAGQHRNGTRCIGVATSLVPSGPYTDVGAPLTCGNPHGGIRAMDPRRVDYPNGSSVLIWGSSSSHGALQWQPLRPDAPGFLPGSSSVPLLSPNASRPFQNLIEGPWIDVDPTSGDQVLYFSGDQCCGSHAHYAVSAAVWERKGGCWVRLSDLPGTSRQSDLVLSANGSSGYWQAPGHNAIARDDAGAVWALYHAYRGADRSKRVLMLDKVEFDGVSPYIGTPSAGERPAPKCRVSV
jgi:arabinan endo-1,5-alpha-L-arabinosidase